MKIKIKITKDVLKRSMWCLMKAGENCAVAIAIRDIFPNAWVFSTTIQPFGYHCQVFENRIYLPLKVTEFIAAFDNANAHMREQMPEFDFEIDVPSAVIDRINIDDIHKSETLEVVEL